MDEVEDGDKMPHERQQINKDYLLTVLKDLVGLKTIAPPGGFYHEIVDYLLTIFKEFGFETEKIIMPQEVFQSRCSDSRLSGDRVNLRAILDVGAKETLVIYTHLDVVPPGNGWSTDPFELVQKNSRLYGRGVSDSKGAVAALIATLSTILKMKKPKYNLGILLTTDEEVGGYSGLCYLTDVGLVKGDFMLCMDTFSDDVVIGSNGSITWEIAVHGKSAHSGSSFLGVNAIEKSIQVMEALLLLKKDIQSRKSSLAASSALEVLDMKNLIPILNITMINGGIKENIIPDKCTLRGDRRVIPEETMEKAMEEIETIIKPLDVQLDLKFFPGYPPMRMNPDHRWVEEVKQAVNKGMGFLPRLSGAQGSLDQAYATDKTKIPTCVYGVGRQLESNIHAANENVRLSDLMGYSRFLTELISS
ncbi:MAG: ArgE/DapE family deacylase [Methanotrichaceae archaeon]|nr:ArgE/DapE family deacylase [Methanotrichaceae archaeon]